ncbi:MAG: undecaprenyl-phosphate glucose phosphotransferase [Candidatus Omnitrophica bacterium]|nr:undecaprenyl-phosphate glucose phosphotransferase [Candidatus Omnitrophota bacterium]MBU1128563.1 undecaprenyl-phosphate glucose phosphotransferase [Candidatus Omnitrophota bacterium]MBU1783729.1 undecaprenyl-phosphate glucose phosphotransferase [Candidatus Omnitrophota bacterium]MBU1851726.1 undecaprenyl-phosphate glucose phosphotransferase [Candidatus Omnitrophota bacterium]
MKIRNDIRLNFILLLGDILAVNAGFLASYWLRFNSGLFNVIYGVPHIFEYVKILPLLTVVCIFLMRSEKLYSIKARLSIVDEFFLIVRADTLMLLIFMAATFIYREYSFSRGMLFMSWVTLLLFIGLWRFTVNRIRLITRGRGERTRRLLLVGDGPMVGRLIRHISGDSHWDYDIAGVVRIKSDDTGKCGGIPVLGKIDDFAGIIGANAIDEIIMTELEVARNTMIDMMLECEKQMIEFRLVADLLGMMTSQVDMRTIDGVPLLGLKESPLAEGYNRFIKRIFDIVFGAMGLLVLFPIFLIISVIIKITSFGSIFYLQKRIGEDGKRFAMIKFRTMINNAEKGVGRVWTQKDDPRRTRIGALLRACNLDELPQLVNVLKGEMSLVGPRPERPHFVGKFKESIPRYMARHKIRSGMTGWAQVNGLRGNTSIEERTKYDIYYIENWSLVFDLKILFMSIFALKNAY